MGDAEGRRVVIGMWMRGVMGLDDMSEIGVVLDMVSIVFRGLPV